jgi:hypothetical protein
MVELLLELTNNTAWNSQGSLLLCLPKSITSPNTHAACWGRSCTTLRCNPHCGDTCCNHCIQSRDEGGGKIRRLVTLNVKNSTLYQCCHVSQGLRRGFGLMNRFIGSSLVVTTISSYTRKITVTIAPVTSHTKSSYSYSSSGHTVVPLELRNSSEVNSHFRILPYPLGTDHAQKTQFYCCVEQTTQKTSHVITISPVRWLADCCLAMSYKHSSCCCVTLSQVFIAPLPKYTRYNMYFRY